jgi:hypothetical protein
LVCLRLNSFFLVINGVLQVKQFKKTILAGALMVVAGGAHANLATQIDPFADSAGLNEAFLVAFDAGYVNVGGSLGRTYNLDLGTTFGALVADPSAALAAYIGAGKTLTDANWTTFVGAGKTASITYGVFAAGDLVNTVNDGAFFTGSTKPGIPSTADWSTVVSAIDQQATDINTGLGLTGGSAQNTVTDRKSSVILATDGAQKGQANYENPFNEFWGATTYNPTVAYGSDAQLYKASVHLDGFGNDAIAASDISNVGKFNLSGNALTFTPVPLPAAVWLFGAGLMGVLRLNRRKSV